VPRISSLLRGGMDPRDTPQCPRRLALDQGPAHPRIGAAAHPRSANPAAPPSSQAGRRKPSCPS